METTFVLMNIKGEEDAGQNLVYIYPDYLSIFNCCFVVFLYESGF